MRHSGSARRLRVLALAGLLAPALSAASRDYRQAYLDGLRALRRDDFRAAADLLSAAVAERGDEQAKARLVGAIPEPYLPHLYLGLAYYGLHDCDRASAAWSESARQGAAPAALPAMTEAAGPRRDCAQLNAAATTIAVARRRLRELEVSVDDDAPGPGRTAATVASALDRAAAELEEGRERWDFAVIAQAAARAAEASTTLDELTEQAAARRRAHALGALTSARDEAAALVEQVGDAPPPRTAANLRTLESLIVQAGSAANPEVSEDAATALAARLRAASADLRLALAELPAPTVTAAAEVPASPSVRPAVSPAPLPSELVAGLEAFLDRDYPAAIALLGRVAGGSPRAGAFALVLRAAAEQALYLLGSGVDSALLAAAVADIRAARRLDPGLEPDPDTFSPRFVALFRDPQ